MDTYADDLSALIDTLDRKDAVLVGHSTDGGEGARYIGRHGTTRGAKAVLLGAVPPLTLQTAAHPGDLPMEAFDHIRAGVLADRSQFFRDLNAPFYGANRPGAAVSQGLRDTLAPGAAGRSQGCPRLPQGVLRERFHLQNGVPGVLTVGLSGSRAVMDDMMSVPEHPCCLYGAPPAHERHTRMLPSLLSAGESRPPPLGPLVPTRHPCPSESARMTRTDGIFSLT
jgi:pimeloyl-ACP methyl ester carboxylesterase